MAARDVDSDDDPSLSTIERLILAQAVYEHGADAWQSVSKLLSKHPALARPKSFFSPQVRLPIEPCVVYSVYYLVLSSNLRPSHERSLTRMVRTVV